MGQCKYKNQQGEHTCNIDTKLFKDNNQEDLFPDLCYFHQIGEAFQNIYLIFDEYIPILNQKITDEYYYEVASMCKDKFSRQIKYCPSVKDFYYNLNQIMFGDYIDKLNMSGFYFPIDSKHSISLKVLNDKEREVCNLEFIFSNIKIYEISFIQTLLNIFSSDKNNNLLGNISSAQITKEFGFGLNANNNSNNRGIFPLSITNIDFQKNIEINSLRVFNYKIKDCIFNSDKIYIQAEKLEISNNNIFNDTVKNVELSVPFRDLELSNPLSDDSLFRYETKVDIYDGYDYYEDSSMYENQPSTNQPKQGLIQNANLKNVRFYECNKNQANRKNHYENLNKLRFVHCEFNNGHKLYEDTNFHAFPEEQRAGILKRLEYNYRYLRKHYDEKGDYIEGNDFHYNYMEAKKKSSSFWDKLLLYPYGWLNGYNTKPGRTIIAILALITISTFINTCYGSFSIKDIYDSGINTNKHDFYASWLYSSANIIPLINKDIFSSQGTITLQMTMVENLLGTILIALLLMALRNRFRRSKTPEEIKEN